MAKPLKQIVQRSKDELLLALIVASTAAASLVVAADLHTDTRRQEAGREFQAMLGGLGMGCHADLSRCSWQFDPRLMDDEDATLDVLSDVRELNPWHSISLFPASSGLTSDF